MVPTPATLGHLERDRITDICRRVIAIRAANDAIMQLLAPHFLVRAPSSAANPGGASTYNYATNRTAKPLDRRN
jgi:hypothetical protein